MIRAAIGGRRVRSIRPRVNEARAGRPSRPIRRFSLIERIYPHHTWNSIGHFSCWLLIISY